MYDSDYDVDDRVKTFVHNKIDTTTKHAAFWIRSEAYGTFLLAFIVITIALNNILIGLSVNIAKEGLIQASYHRLNAMAYSLCGYMPFHQRIMNTFCCLSG